MKHLKLYEDFDDEFEIGEYVIVIRAYRSKESSFPVNIKTGDRCKIIGPGMSNVYVIIENEDGFREDYRKNRITPEVKYNRDKFNI